MARRVRRKPLPEPVEARIESLDQEGRGVTHVDGKATFVQGALPGERVRFRYTKTSKTFDEGEVEQVLEAASQRVTPRCSAFGRCGGCRLQHLEPGAQLLAKEQVVRDALQRLGRVQPTVWLPPLQGERLWGYRGKARLGVRRLKSSGEVLVGFREMGSSFIARTESCPVLDSAVGEALPALVELVAGSRIADQIPQIEVAVGDEHRVLLLRVLAPPAPEDLVHWRTLAARQGWTLYVQPGGYDSVHPLEGDPVPLGYALPEWDLQLRFAPMDFTQVNTEMNRMMLHQAMQLLRPAAGDAVLDLFCGLGNFTLPLARLAGQVLGVEGEPGLVARARDNAVLNGLTNVDFMTADLYGEALAAEPWLQRRFDLAVLDPPRSGAQAVLAHLPRLGVRRVLYVSCYPGTLARDAGILVHEHGYQLQSVGVMDMFPHTTHVESMALFELDATRVG